MKPSQQVSLFVLVLMILAAAATRIIPHWPNFTALGAMALFGAAQLPKRWMAFVVPFAALYLSDLIINNILYAGFYDHFVWRISPFIYLAFGLIVLIGFLLRGRISVGRVAGAGVGASVLFFLLTNFGVWLGSGIYPQTGAGLLAAYGAGLPFFWSTLAGDLFYCGVFFGGYAWLSQAYPQLQRA